MKEVIVLSLGGSLIVPDRVDTKFLRKFKKEIKKHFGKYRFVVVCGGGSVARKYIYALREVGVEKKFQSMSGISSTRMNARFMSNFFRIDTRKGIPKRMRKIKSYLKKQDIVFCGALEYKPKQTTDSTSAEIAKKFNAKFINLTNVKGLYNKDPAKFKNAKFIPKISWKDFNKMANKHAFMPGQHFVLDQTSSKIIMRNKIPTYILGKDLKQLSNLLKGKKFIGTSIEN